jgi:hypothetical protein
MNDLPNTLDGYFLECPILARELIRTTSMDVLVVYLFWRFPYITNAELSGYVLDEYPMSTWAINPLLRAEQARRKYNAGDFRCMGGWAPDCNGPRWATGGGPSC